MRSRSPLQSFTSLHSALRQVPTISWRFNLYQIYSSTLCDQWLDIRVQCHVEAHEGGHPRWHGQRHGDVLLLWTGGLLSQAGIQVRQFLFSRLRSVMFEYIVRQSNLCLDLGELSWRSLGQHYDRRRQSPGGRRDPPPRSAGLTGADRRSQHGCHTCKLSVQNLV